MDMEHEDVICVSVVIVGAGPSGIATSALLNSMSVSNVVLEREDCCASLWRKRSYDCLSLHLPKNFCSLPMMPHPFKTSTFMSKNNFISYLDDYVSRFNVNPRYCHDVESAVYEADERKWRITVKNKNDSSSSFSSSSSLSSSSLSSSSSSSGNKNNYNKDNNKKILVYVADFLVVASGENSQANVPNDLVGLETFTGEVVHSSDYKCGASFKDKEVLVIGCGNSGMEISNDLADCGARTSIVIRSQLHVLSKEMVGIGMLLSNYLPVKMADRVVSLFAKFRYGDLSSYGIHRPLQGPFLFKALAGKTPVIDRGTINKIRSQKIQVYPEIVRINQNAVEFKNGAQRRFDAILLATGYRSVAHKWLKEYTFLLNDDGKPKTKYPKHWMGENGVYCVGLSGRGLPGIFTDSKAVAEDIHQLIMSMPPK